MKILFKSHRRLSFILFSLLLPWQCSFLRVSRRNNLMTEEGHRQHRALAVGM
jgi:hypothetical protein